MVCELVVAVFRAWFVCVIGHLSVRVKTGIYTRCLGALNWEFEGAIFALISLQLRYFSI